MASILNHLLVSLFAISLASTRDFPIAHPRSNLSRIIQQSNIFCQRTSDCLNSDLGVNSACVHNYCVCEFGYKVDYSSGKCSRISCNYSSDCNTYFTDSHCNFTKSCACNVNYSQEKVTQSCERRSCTLNTNCTGAFTTCSENTCICLSGYYEDSDGACRYEGPYSGSTPLDGLLGLLGGAALLIIIVTIIIIIVRRRRMKRAGVVVSPPTGQQPASGTGPQPNVQSHPQPQPYPQPQPQQYPGQAGYPAPSAYQQAYQPAPPMYPAPYSPYDQGPQPPPQYAPPYSHASVPPVAMQTHPQPYAQTSSYQAVSSKVQL